MRGTGMTDMVAKFDLPMTDNDVRRIMNNLHSKSRYVYRTTLNEFVERITPGLNDYIRKQSGVAFVPVEKYSQRFAGSMDLSLKFKPSVTARLLSTKMVEYADQFVYKIRELGLKQCGEINHDADFMVHNRECMGVYGWCDVETHPNGLGVATSYDASKMTASEKLTFTTTNSFPKETLKTMFTMNGGNVSFVGDKV
jgi:hypothetical protein